MVGAPTVLWRIYIILWCIKGISHIAQQQTGERVSLLGGYQMSNSPDIRRALYTWKEMRLYSPWASFCKKNQETFGCLMKLMHDANYQESLLNICEMALDALNQYFSVQKNNYDGFCQLIK